MASREFAKYSRKIGKVDGQRAVLYLLRLFGELDECSSKGNRSSKSRNCWHVNKFEVRHSVRFARTRVSGLIFRGRLVTLSNFIQCGISISRSVLGAYDFGFGARLALLCAHCIILVLPHPSIAIESVFFRTISINYAAGNTLPARSGTHEVPPASLVDLTAHEDISGSLAECARFGMVFLGFHRAEEELRTCAWRVEVLHEASVMESEVGSRK